MSERLEKAKQYFVGDVPDRLAIKALAGSAWVCSAGMLTLSNGIGAYDANKTVIKSEAKIEAYESVDSSADTEIWEEIKEDAKQDRTTNLIWMGFFALSTGSGVQFAERTRKQVQAAEERSSL